MAIKFRNLDPSLKGRFGDVPRRKRHVVKSGAANEDYLRRRSEGDVYNSVCDAVDDSEAFDEVIVWPGEWTEDATINLNKEGMTLRGWNVGSGPGMASAELWQYANVNTPVVTIAAKGVEVCGLQILPYSAANLTTAVGIAVGLATESKYFYIHDNYLRAVATANGPSLIVVGTASVADAQMGMIENNYFRQGGSSTGASAQIYLGQATGTTIRGNNFLIAGNGTGYNCIHGGTAIVQRIVVQENLFMAFEVGGCLAINPGTGSTTDGHMYISKNDFIGFTAEANCFTYNADNAGENYLAGVLIDS